MVETTDIRYEGASSRRKELVKAIGEIMNTEPVYQAAPTFSYSIGEVTVDRNGIVSFDDSIDPAVFDRLIDGLAERGFEAENLPGAEPEAEAQTVTEEEVDAEARTEVGVEVGTTNDAEDPAASPVETSAEWDELVIEMPRESFSENAITNLERLLASKASPTGSCTM